MSILLCSKCFIWQIWKRIQERADKFCVTLFLSCKEPYREKSNLQSYNIRTCTNLGKDAQPSCSGSCWVIKCISICEQKNQWNQILHVVYLACCDAASLRAHLQNKWPFRCADFYLHQLHSAVPCWFLLYPNSFIKSSTKPLQILFDILKVVESFFSFFIKQELLKRTSVPFSQLVWKCTDVNILICTLAFFWSVK